jgi:hypothetical protein
VLHWSAGPHGKQVLLAGDALHVVQDRRHVTFMYSVPNYITSHPDNVEQIRQRLDGLHFDDLYGFTWGLNIIGDARAAVDTSFDRYLRAVGRTDGPSTLAVPNRRPGGVRAGSGRGRA